MKKEEFEKIYGALVERRERCDDYLADIHTTEDLADMTIKTAANLKAFCAAEQSCMDKVAMIELYHIIGMGNLTATQMSKFCKELKAYLEYRSLIKCINYCLCRIDSLPNIPVRNTYKLSVLSDITLVSGPEDGELIEDFDDIVDCSSTLTNPTIPFTLKGKEISIPEDKLEEFARLKGRFGCAVGDLATLKSKIGSSSEYWGVKWAGAIEGKVYGTVISSSVYTRLKKLAIEG